MFAEDVVGMRRIVALLRITLGIIILATWVDNLTKGVYSAGGISGLFDYIFDENGGGATFYRALIGGTILQAPGVFGAFQLVAEFLMGAGLLLGLFTPIAGLGAAIFFFNLLLAYLGGQEWIWIYVLLTVSAVVVALTRSGRAWGMDALLCGAAANRAIVGFVKTRIDFMTRRALLVMAKEPVAGRIKTRLTPPLTPGQAADLYTRLLRDTLDSVREAAHSLRLTPFIAFYPQQAASFFQDLAPDFELLAQKGGDLGERLGGVLLGAQALGYEQAAAINSDSPGLPATYLAQAFAELDDPAVDVVLGPCDDGGYYLIGWKRPFSQLVRDVEMSTPRVLADTLALARRDGVRTALLPAWYDVDTAADLARLRANGHGGRHTEAFFGE